MLQKPIVLRSPAFSASGAFQNASAPEVQQGCQGSRAAAGRKPPPARDSQDQTKLPSRPTAAAGLPPVV